MKNIKYKKLSLLLVSAMLFFNLFMTTACQNSNDDQANSVKKEAAEGKADASDEEVGKEAEESEKAAESKSEKKSEEKSSEKAEAEEKDQAETGEAADESTESEEASNDADDEDEKAAENKKENDEAEEEKEEYEKKDQAEEIDGIKLKGGFYEAGIDLPAGKFDVKLISGDGSLISSNLLNGGIAETFGDNSLIDGLDEYQGVDFPEGEKLQITGSLCVALKYSEIEKEAEGRVYDAGMAAPMTAGKYVVGKDIAPGVYKIVWQSGYGMVATDNITDDDFGTAITELFGTIPGQDFDVAEEFSNLLLKEGVTLEIAGEVELLFIPEKD